MGLLDNAMDSPMFRIGLGLLSGAGQSANAGQILASAMQGNEDYKVRQQQAKRATMQDEMQQMQMVQAQAQMAQQQKIREGMGQFFKPGQQALSPLLGDPSAGIIPSAGRAAIGPSFDFTGAAQFLAQNGEYEKAMSMMPKREQQINKLDAKDYTPASVAKFSQSGNYGDLVRMDKAQFQNTGGSTMALDPFTGKPLNVIQNTQSPDSKASTAVSWANFGLSKDRLNFDKQGGADGMKPKLVGDQWVTAPNDMMSGEVRPAMPSVAKKDATEALELIKSAREIIPKSTGSYLGTGIDQAARVFGASTGGDTAAAQLKALEGALVSKMPKMSGPQSDKDVQLYKQMAGEIGDPTIPQSRKLAALQTIEQIQQRHSGVQPQSMNVTPTATPTMRWNPKTNSIEMVN